MSFLSLIVTWTYINIFSVSPHPPFVSVMYTQTHRDTLVLKPVLVALRYCDGMKGGTVALFYNLLLELDIYYSKPIEGLDEAMRKKMHNVFMSRCSALHAPIHSAAFEMDKQFCRRDMDHGVKKDIRSVMEDFSKGPGGQDLTKLKSQYSMFVDALGSKQVFQYVLRESLDDALYHLLPWDIELIIDDPVDEPEEEPEL